MAEYRRLWAPGTTWFFTADLAERKGHRLLVDPVDDLHAVFLEIRLFAPLLGHLRRQSQQISKHWRHTII